VNSLSFFNIYYITIDCSPSIDYGNTPGSAFVPRFFVDYLETDIFPYHLHRLHRFLCVYVFLFLCFFHTAYISYYCNTVGWTRWDWRPILRTLSSFSALTLLVELFDLWKPVPDMTHNVFDGTLSLTQPNPTVDISPPYPSRWSVDDPDFFLYRDPVQFLPYIAHTHTNICGFQRALSVVSAIVSFLTLSSHVTFSSLLRQVWWEASRENLRQSGIQRGSWNSVDQYFYSGLSSCCYCLDH